MLGAPLVLSLSFFIFIRRSWSTWISSVIALFKAPLCFVEVEIQLNSSYINSLSKSYSKVLHCTPLTNHTADPAFTIHIFTSFLMSGASFIWDVRLLNLFAYVANSSFDFLRHYLRCSILARISIDWKYIENCSTSSSHNLIDPGW